MRQSKTVTIDTDLLDFIDEMRLSLSDVLNDALRKHLIEKYHAPVAMEAPQ